jgi:hypothetical protein
MAELEFRVRVKAINPQPINSILRKRDAKRACLKRALYRCTEGGIATPLHEILLGRGE